MRISRLRVQVPLACVVLPRKHRCRREKSPDDSYRQTRRLEVGGMARRLAAVRLIGFRPEKRRTGVQLPRACLVFLRKHR